MKTYLTSIAFIVFNVVNIGYCTIFSDINKYFNAESEFAAEWEKHEQSIEKSILQLVKDAFGSHDLSISKGNDNIYELSKGVFFSDGNVQLLLLNLKMPLSYKMETAALKISLPNNYLRIQADLSKMVLQSFYVVFRNNTAVVNEFKEDANLYSPFSFQRVPEEGHLAIIAEDCAVTGILVTRLKKDSIHFVHDSFRLDHCKYNVEISNRKLASEPVITRYFSPEQSRVLEQLMLAPIKSELMMVLQVQTFIGINTTNIFGSELELYRSRQEKMFALTSNFMSKIVNKINKLTVEKKLFSTPMTPMDIYVEGKPNDISDNLYIGLSEVKLSGLDTLYSSNTCGPYKYEGVAIAGEIRYGRLQVRGKITYITNHLLVSEFCADLLDVAVNLVTAELVKKDNNFNQSLEHKVQLVGCGQMSFSIGEVENLTEEPVSSQAIVSGYLLNEVPKLVKKHLSQILTEAVVNQEMLNEEENEAMSSKESDDNTQKLIKPLHLDADVSDVSDNGSNYTLPKIYEKIFSDSDIYYDNPIDTATQPEIDDETTIKPVQVNKLKYRPSGKPIAVKMRVKYKETNWITAKEINGRNGSYSNRKTKHRPKSNSKKKRRKPRKAHVKKSSLFNKNMWGQKASKVKKKGMKKKNKRPLSGIIE